MCIKYAIIQILFFGNAVQSVNEDSIENGYEFSVDK